jgi:dTDP-glucose pyrophosphorylase
MKCVVPLAGPDFYNESYGIKPLYDLNGIPLIEEALSSRFWINNGELLEEDLIFVLKESEHAKAFAEYLSKTFPKSKLCYISQFTKGAILSASVGVSIINDPDEPIIIDLVDILFESDFSPTEVFSNPEVNGILPYFSSDSIKYSYLDIKDNQVVKTAEKKVISNHASAGVYFFRNQEVFFRALHHSLIHAEDLAVNGILFVCPAFNGIIEQNKKVIPYFVKITNELSSHFH